MENSRFGAVLGSVTGDVSPSRMGQTLAKRIFAIGLTIQSSSQCPSQEPAPCHGPNYWSFIDSRNERRSSFSSDKSSSHTSLASSSLFHSPTLTEYPCFSRTFLTNGGSESVESGLLIPSGVAAGRVQLANMSMTQEGHYDDARSGFRSCGKRRDRQADSRRPD